jgi:hypothetical protein
MTDDANDIETAMRELRTPDACAWCIISVYRPHLLGPATRAAARGSGVRVIVDRRVGERRRPERAESDASRLRERRGYRIDEPLRTRGFAIVPRNA